ncbi:MAG TPA: septum formation inhibitor Maf [Rheinheimera sp.]|uniref:motility associated factor glycosyltransferase family protein n=1 Tax=Rheinheimera sp. TaxID=1869214 RepID=UPI000EC9C360|nr:6-hydroxymethylpterin diphosphokinase MptE-like protein [Rheinheimera sp.]HCU66603.1 septum formation inhibitor Maf [Rheinheimera sp.]
MTNDLEKQLEELEAKLAQVVLQEECEKQFSEISKRRFSKNLEAFEKYYPEIFESIKNYKKRSDFKFIVRTSDLADFVPSGQDIPLYGVDVLDTIEKQVERYSNNAFFSMTKYGFGVQSDDYRIHVRYMHALDNLLADFYGKKFTPISKLPKHFPSAIIFGVGLGYHIPMLLEKHTFDYLFISEPDLELFYASLYCIDWCEIIHKIDIDGRTLFLQVGVSYKDFFATLKSVATDIGAFSLVRSYCYQHYPSTEVNELIKEFFERYGDLQLGFGFYNDAITGFAHGIQNLNNGYPFFYRTKEKVKLPHVDIPAFIVGNGPSLDDAADLLRQINDRVIIFASGTALGSLIKMGVNPDFHVLVERPKSTYDILLDTQPKEIYKKFNLLTVDVMYPDVLDLYNWAGVGLKGPEASTFFIYQHVGIKKQKLLIPLSSSGPLVVNTALSYAVSMGFKDIYLVGVDNGYINQATHSKFSIYVDESLDIAKTVNKNARHKLEGNFGGTVMATDLLRSAKIQMEGLIASSKGTVFYNVGNGAKLNGAYPLTIDDVICPQQVINKNDIVDGIKENLFIDLDLKVESDDVDFALFSEVCEHMISICEERYSSIAEASDLLRRQARYIYAFSNTRCAYIFHMIKGSLLYYHCPMITMLYSFEEEEQTLHYFSKAMDLWVKYLKEIKSDFPVNWNTKCDWGMDMEFKSVLQ